MKKAVADVAKASPSETCRVQMTFIDYNGTVKLVDAAAGQSILEIGQRNGIDLEGACEGCMACSTCHVIVDPAWSAKLPPPGEEEEDMLDLAYGVKKTSRLGCQIEMSDELDGLVVRVPSEHHNMMG